MPPPMAHNEVPLGSNAIDVAFSKSGTRFAVLMHDHFSVFLWALKNRPVPSPILESSYPLSDAPDSRPRQIAFLNETEIYVLKNAGPNNTQVERTTVETRVTKVAHQAADSEQLFSIFPSLGHETLWLSHSGQNGQPITYSNIEQLTPDEFQVVSWVQCPTVDTYWAKAVQVSEDKVCFVVPRFHSNLLTQVAYFGLYDENWSSLCQQAVACKELHFIPCDHHAHFVHYFSASP